MRRCALDAQTRGRRALVSAGGAASSARSVRTAAAFCERSRARGICPGGREGERSRPGVGRWTGTSGCSGDGGVAVVWVSHTHELSPASGSPQLDRACSYDFPREDPPQGPLGSAFPRAASETEATCVPHPGLAVTDAPPAARCHVLCSGETAPVGDTCAPSPRSAALPAAHAGAAARAGPPFPGRLGLESADEREGLRRGRDGVAPPPPPAMGSRGRHGSRHRGVDARAASSVHRQRKGPRWASRPRRALTGSPMPPAWNVLELLHSFPSVCDSAGGLAPRVPRD